MREFETTLIETAMADMAVDAAEKTEGELVDAARTAVSQCNWTVGECAAEWTKKYARGRTDADFARLVGLSPDQVYQRRRVWERFGLEFRPESGLKWSHYYVALNWEDADACLEWAEENSATVAELRAWRRVLHGDEDPSAESPPDPFGGDPSITFLSNTPTEVKAPGDWQPGEGGGEGPYQKGTAEQEMAAAVARSAGENGDYAPFRPDAASPGPGESNGSARKEPPTPEQLAKKIASGLERFTAALTDDLIEDMRSLPEAKRTRIFVAAEELMEKLASLR
ncbi:helix-turn-helix domain-containing protein [Stratiformator vulcanicus]|uniref:Insertion element IS150 protein InsJ-like helix-turn-helix domain-containing protein n=1 Tax=Stratiformator vulcanicus TaxID=2527980 RepID=A0A517R6M0_9PLAN|nr:helix-turn-helix domain-containing protein [Stratiformator vulcanicus]QDT39544.1 hypothetical protein Pan189_39520 [Stratiformator vulcanicus]